MAGEEAAMAFGGRACSMTTVHCGATSQGHTSSFTSIFSKPYPLESYLRVVSSKRTSASLLPSTALKRSSDRFVFSDLHRGAGSELWRSVPRRASLL
jgi:hypothetical protein